MSPEPSLDDARPISDPSLIENLDKDANQVYMLVGELRALTAWDERFLLKHLGCDPGAPRPSEALAEQLMNHSIAYLTWVRNLCYLVDRPVDRHDILQGAYELCANVGGAIDGRVRRCVEACSVPGRDDLSANDLFTLGEVSRGWLQATATFDGGHDRERAMRIIDLTTPRDPTTTHLHPRRLQALHGDYGAVEREIGVGVAQRMQEHLALCERCDKVAQELWRSPTRLETSGHTSHRKGPR